MSKPLQAAVCAIALTMASGCYHSRIILPAPAATDPETRTVHSLFWGLQQENVEPSNCTSNALQQVRVDWSLGYAFLTVITLGIWSPMTVQWQCAKTPAPPLAPAPLADAQSSTP
jgi:hypothetical protein